MLSCHLAVSDPSPAWEPECSGTREGRLSNAAVETPLSPRAPEVQWHVPRWLVPLMAMNCALAAESSCGYVVFEREGESTRGYGDVIANQLRSADVTCDIETLVVPGNGYMFPRNLGLWNGSAVLLGNRAKLEALHRDGKGNSTAVLEQYYRSHGVATAMLPYTINAANIAYDDGVLVLATADRHGFACESAAQPAVGCDNQLRHLARRFGDRSVTLHIEPAGAGCYDLDIYYQPVTDAKGKRYALVYPDCIKEYPASPGAIGRQAFLLALKEAGIEPIEIGDHDVQDLAANFISPERGKLAFTMPINELKGRLEALGFTVIQPRRPNSVTRELAPQYVGLHCLTLEMNPSASHKCTDKG